ncbi:MAG: DUF5673 domain-containing protein [Patescibacteria group bacterium]|mgnify:CR=1 FL=1
MEKLLEWETPEFKEYKKGVDWYWYLALFAVLLLIFAALERSFLFGAFVVIGWFTIMLHSARVPKIIKISISEKGILVEQNLYSWENIKSFWIFKQKKEISLELKKTLMPYLKIFLEETDSKTAREILLNFIPEKEQNESFIDNLADLLRF